MRIAWFAVLAWLGSARTQEVDAYQEAFVRFPAVLGDCPSFEEFRHRAYDRLQAGVVHPLRMLARTQAQAEKARCEELRDGLDKALAQDWSGWSAQAGLVGFGTDTKDPEQAMQGREFEAVHTLALEVGGLDVIRNGNRLEHQATFKIKVVSRRGSDSAVEVSREISGTGFGDLARALEELSALPRRAALRVLDDPRFGRRARVVAIDDRGLAGAWRFAKGPGGMLPGRRLQVLDSLGEGAWAIAWRPTGADRIWEARMVGGRIPQVGQRLREIPGDVAWRLGLVGVQGGAQPGLELRGGPRVPVGPSVRVGMDATVRTQDFQAWSPQGVPLGWGVGFGLEPEVGFQRNWRWLVCQAGLRPGLRMDLAPVRGGEKGMAQGAGWARRAELNATLQVSALAALDPFHCLGMEVSWDAFQGRGVWSAPDRDVVRASGAGRWRGGLVYRFQP